MSPIPQAALLQAEATAPARFVVGQDLEGFWVALEIHGRAGGLFRSQRDAVHFAEDETGGRPDAVMVSGERIMLRL